MRPIKKKLQSERGASITFGLLIFLVCTVIGSAVLVAGTTASGRMSKMAENDQRYYAVNSAARLLIEVLPKDKIKYEEHVPEDEEEDPPAYDLFVGTENGGTESWDPAPTPPSLGVKLAELVLNMPSGTSNIVNSEPPAFTMEAATGSSLPTGANLGINGSVTINKMEGDNSADLIFDVTSGAYTLKVFFTNTAPPPYFEWTLDHIERVEREQTAEESSPTADEGGGA